MKEIKYNWDLAHGCSERVAKAHVKFRLFQFFSWWYACHQHDKGTIDWTQHCQRQFQRNRQLAIKYYL